MFDAKNREARTTQSNTPNNFIKLDLEKKVLQNMTIKSTNLRIIILSPELNTGILKFVAQPSFDALKRRFKYYCTCNLLYRVQKTPITIALPLIHRHLYD